MYLQLFLTDGFNLMFFSKAWTLSMDRWMIYQSIHRSAPLSSSPSHRQQMGICLSDFSQSSEEPSSKSRAKLQRVLLLGLDGAGKSTLLFKLKVGEYYTVPPTNHIHVDMLNYRNLAFISWDLSGATKVDPPWTCYLQHVQAVVFVVDATDRGRIREAADELHNLFGYRELKDAKLLVFANKQDKQGCMSAREIYESLNLGIATGTPHHVQRSAMVRRKGLYEGLEWLNRALNGRL